jgi:hypothetical protein
VGLPIEKLDRSALPSGVQATLLTRSSVGDLYRFSSENAFRARFLSFYFPGWRARLDGESVPIHKIRPLGLIAVDIPAGDHELEVRFRETPFRLAMNVLSVLGLVGLAGFLIAQRRRHRDEDDELAEPAVDVKPVEFTWLRVWLLGIMLLVLFAGKVGFVDSRTSWFRRESSLGQVADVQHPMNVLLEDNVRFLGYDLVRDEIVRGGDMLQVRLYWQADGPVSGDYISFIHLDAPPDSSTFLTGDNYQPGDPQAQIDMPSNQWQPELYVRDEHRLKLADGIPPIAYALQAGLYERETGQRLSILPGQEGGQGGDTIFLQEIHVLSPRSVPTSAMESGGTYGLGESIELLGYDLSQNASGDESIQPGQELSVTLYWRTLEPLTEDYTVFVHLLDEAGTIRAQRDSPPMNGRYPTGSWLPNQIVEDKTTLSLGADLLPEEYRIAVGMYELETGERLEVKGGDEALPGNAILLRPILRVESPK